MGFSSKTHEKPKNIHTQHRFEQKTVASDEFIKLLHRKQKQTNTKKITKYFIKLVAIEKFSPFIQIENEIKS